MYDTVAASIRVRGLPDVWDFTETTRRGEREIMRSWRNRDDLRLTYWRGLGDPLLKIEFSIARLTHSHLRNPTQPQTMAALDYVDFELARLFNVPAIRTWHASRVDYSWNWTLERTEPYLMMFAGLHLSGAIRHVHDYGTVWKSKRKNVRWVKVYDKGRELGELDRHVLRFEVSNFKRILPYMCKWFGTDQTVDAVLHPGRALYVMAHVWHRLGLAEADAYRATDDHLMLRLRDAYGRAAPAAYYALSAIQRHGTDAHKVYNLLSPNSYYKWRKKLTDHNFLAAAAEETIDRLELPTYDVFNILTANRAAIPHDLVVGDHLTAKAQKKFLEFLGLTAAPSLGYLDRRWAEYVS